RPEAFRRAVRLADHEEFPITDEERTRTDCDRKGRDVEGHGPRHASERDGFIPGLVPRPPRWAMQRKVGFTPRGFLKRIWQLGNFDVSPDGRLLAFAANKGDQWSVYLLDLRTKKDRILLQSEQSVLNPEFSPDGRWIAVQSDFEGDENYNIYLVPVRGAHVQKITDTAFDSAFPRWSPDGTKIAFLSNRDGDRDNVFVVDTGGGDAKQLTYLADIGVLDVKTKKVRFVVQSRWDKTMPLWAPDGKRIAFLENRDGNVQLRTVSRDGKGARAVSSAKGSASRAVWTPDAKGLFYQHS